MSFGVLCGYEAGTCSEQWGNVRLLDATRSNATTWCYCTHPLHVYSPPGSYRTIVIGFYEYPRSSSTNHEIQPFFNVHKRKSMHEVSSSQTCGKKTPVHPREKIILLRLPDFPPFFSSKKWCEDYVCFTVQLKLFIAWRWICFTSITL